MLSWHPVLVVEIKYWLDFPVSHKVTIYHITFLLLQMCSSWFHHFQLKWISLIHFQCCAILILFLLLKDGAFCTVISDVLFISEVEAQSSNLFQAGRNLRTSIDHPLSQSRASCGVRPGCSWLVPGFEILPNTEMSQHLGATAVMSPRRLCGSVRCPQTCLISRLNQPSSLSLSPGNKCSRPATRKGPLKLPPIYPGVCYVGPKPGHCL